MSLAHIAHIIPVLSGKGGVGKSSTTVQLALTLCLQGHTVGVLDIDLTGPSIPRLFGIEDAKITQAPGGWLPVQVHPPINRATIPDQTPQNASAKTTNSDTPQLIGALYCMSLGFLLSTRSDAVIWRGPKKTAMVGQLLTSVLWPADLEYLIIDTPPGTSDEHIALATSLLDPTKIPNPHVLGAVVVTTPQAIATADVRKELSFCRKTGLRVLGIVENMAGYVCPCCGEVTNVFSKGGGEVMAREWGATFLGSVPVDGVGWGMLVEEGRRPVYAVTEIEDDDKEAQIANGECEEGQSQDREEGFMVEKYTSCSLYPIFDHIVKHILDIR